MNVTGTATVHFDIDIVVDVEELVNDQLRDVFGPGFVLDDVDIDVVTIDTF